MTITVTEALTRTLVAVLVAAALVAPGPASAQDRPLLVEGKQTVHQRVLTRPDALLFDEQGGEATRRLPAFQPFYVYGAEPGWYQVGPSLTSGPTGWLRAGSAVMWKQNIVAAFTNPAGRKRQLLFESEDRLRWLMEHEALREMQSLLLTQVEQDSLPPERGVVAAEPAEFVDIVQELYLMPILDFTQDLHPLTYEDNLLMKLASVPLREEGEDRAPQKDDFDVGIVFVFDTTQSMDPYIARTQTAVERIVRGIQGTEIGDRVHFGVVAFRDNPEGAPGLDYRTRTLLPLARRSDKTAVLATIRAATEVATVSSPGFNEDSLAGVEDALELTDWDAGGTDPFDSRIVILVTDAGPKDPRDPNARSPIGPKELQAAAQAKGVAMMTLHLQTRSGGEAQHAYARRQYQDLSRFHGETYYYGIKNGAPEVFEAKVSELVTVMTDMIRTARDEAPVLQPDDTGDELQALGRAMRLAYLGRLKGTQAPDVIEGWVSQKAVEDPGKLAFEPRLLVTKNELATMADLLSEYYDLGEQTRDAEDASAFFTQVQGVIARMAQNPDRLVATEADTLGGALEFLEDLPYRSQLLQIDRAYWESSPMNRRMILDGMRQKLTQYRKWLLDPDVWTPLHDGAPDGEHVFAMPFDVLP